MLNVRQVADFCNAENSSRVNSLIRFGCRKMAAPEEPVNLLKNWSVVVSQRYDEIGTANRIATASIDEEIERSFAVSKSSRLLFVVSIW